SLLSSNIHNNEQQITTDVGIRLFDLSESIIQRIVSEAITDARSLAASMDIDIGDSESENTQNKDELKQIQLAQEVRDTALVQNSQFVINADSSDIYKTIQQSISLLFGVNNSLVVNLDESQQFLSIAKKQHLTDTCLFEDLKIDISGNSILSRCLNKKQIIDSFSAKTSASLSIIDEQIAHGLKTEGFVCLPVTNSNRLHGVVLLGCSNNQALKLLKNSSLLKLFADNLSIKLQQYLDYSQKTSEASEKNSLIFIERARKIIHETNNPLTVIRNYLQLLSKKLNEDDPAQADLSTIKQEIDRISNIIIRCKDAPNVEASDFSEININTLLTELISLYKASLFATHNITSTLNLDNKLKPVRLDKNSIKQIITNLLKNSVEAIKSDGEIIITTGTININGNNYIELKLEDSGPGIPAEIMKNLYTPVTSTKGQEHSGLGLSITKNLVDRTGGSISCRTNNNGTVFSVQFPETN
ncbi:MAG: ATP-binding protein, partial [Gammaproteobacteria bacterium]|nr:ATP-binding protein [Gammaproteobacteria bacterium]